MSGFGTVGPSSILPFVQSLQERLDVDQKNGGPTALDKQQMTLLISDINSVLKTGVDDVDANTLKTLLSSITCSDPYANSVFDNAANQFENSVYMQALLGGGTELMAKGAMPPPALVMPANPATMQVWLSQLEAQSAGSELQGDLSGIQVSGENQHRAADNALAEALQAQQSAENAAATQQQSTAAAWCSTIFGLIGAALGMVAAVFAAGATFGAGSALIAVAAVGLAMAIDGVINQGLQQANVQTTGVNGQSEPLDVSLGGMVKAIVQQQVKDGTIAVAPATGKPGALVFKSQADLDSYITGMTAFANTLIAVALIAGGGVAAGSMASSATTVAEEAVNATADTVQTTTDVVDSSTKAGSDVAGTASKGGSQPTDGADPNAQPDSTTGGSDSDSNGGTMGNIAKKVGEQVKHAWKNATPVERASAVMDAIVDLGAGASTIAESVLDAKRARIDYTTAQDQAMQQTFQAIADYVSTYVSSQSDNVKVLEKFIQDVQNSASTVLANYTQTASYLGGHMGAAA